MATNMPSTIPELLNWANTHMNLWADNAASIGVAQAAGGRF